MNMRQEGLFIVFALTFALDAGFVLGQDNAADEKGSDLDVSITLEDASQPRAAAADLALPIEQEPAAPPGQERRFEPADFAQPNRLESIQIAASDLPRGTTAAAVRCQAFIARDGKLGEYHCIADDMGAYVKAVIDAVPMQRFAAARVDGESVRVLMNFAVYVDCGSGACVAVAARNHGYHIERLGLDYVDPQPILESDDWYEGFDYKLIDWKPRTRNAYRRGFAEKVPYVMAVEVDASGLAGPGCLVWAVPARPVPGMPGLGRRVAPMQTPRTKLYLEKAIGSLRDVRYVPGMIDGRAATLTLYEESVTRFDLGSNSEALFSLGDIECEASSPR